MKNMRIWIVTALCVCGAQASAFTTIGTKWGMGPNFATPLAGFEGTPGFFTWSVMGAGLPVVVGSDLHEDGLSTPFGSLLGGAGMTEEMEAIGMALTKWSSVAGIGFVFVEDGGAPGGGLEAVGGHLGDMRFGAYDEFPSTVLAHAFGPGTETMFGPGGTIRGDIHMNSSKLWVDDPFDPEGGPYDLQTVLIHEIGHALGLGHTTVPGSVMGAEYIGGNRTLGHDDIEGIRHIYGPVPEPSTIAVIGLGAVLLRRRRRAR